jgi:tRNA-Thr(GGU) m(6)t(6)A37 methyltransferase TsaA
MSVPVVVARRSYQTCFRSTFKALVLLTLWIIVLIAGSIFSSGGQPAWSQDKPAGDVAMQTIGLDPVGRVERRDGKIFVELQLVFAEALDGIQGFSHIWVIYWFHGNDTPEKRRTLKVHPRGNPANPLTGVFATRSPARPNLVGLDACRLVRREGNRLEVTGLDAWDGSPVLDIKPYLPQLDSFPHTTIPAWAQGKPPE